MTKKTSRREKGITLIALIVTIIVLLILAGVTINMAVNKQGIFSRAKVATGAYKSAAEGERTGLDEADKEIEKYMPKDITYTDSDGKTQTLKKDTQAGTKIGNTTITNSDNEEIKLDWYLFDVSDDGKTAYLVSTPTYWVPDTTKEVSGAYVPKLVSVKELEEEKEELSNTYAMRQAIQQLANGTNSYSSIDVKYIPTKETLEKFTKANSDWAKSENSRSTQEFSKWNENEQCACYLYDEDIFAGIKSQVNKADGNLKGKIQTLVGAPSVEQWCKAYNKQAEVKNAPTKQITCEYYSTSGTSGYIYKVNGTAQNSGWKTNTDTIFGNDIYGAAHKNGNTSLSNPFYYSSNWWLASPSFDGDDSVCYIDGEDSYISRDHSRIVGIRVSLFASVAL